VNAVNGLIDCVETFSAHFGHDQRRRIVDKLCQAAVRIEHFGEDVQS
jgi:hypothetical protein